MNQAKKTAESSSAETHAPEGDAIKAEFTRRWYRQMAISSLVLVFLMPMLVLSEQPGGAPSWLLVAALGSALVGLAGSFWNWRCPHCNSYLGKRFFWVRFCQSCGTGLS